MAGSGSYCYDVFISYRGEDTRLGFTGFLYKTLSEKGFHTFFDHHDDAGRGISKTLVDAIEESRIGIVVLSKNYASSTWCLDELVYIIDSFSKKNNSRRSVFPVFYNVDPSHVRYQTGGYGQALDEHRKNNFNSEKLKKWRNALNQVANFSGFHFKHGDGYEYELIDKIVDLVSTKIDSTPYLRVVDHPIGLNYRVLEVNWLLNHTHAATAVGSHGLKLLGIYGMGGIGKTTLARAVFNFISPQFDAFCFLEDVRENSANRGLVHLQQTLLATLAGQKKKKKDFQLASISEGLLLLKNMLHRKKVLLVLDDVNNSDQLQATLGGGPDSFGYGTTIIITTRDKHYLTTHGVHTTYKVEELTKDESLELLCWNAFKTNKIYPDYIDLLNHVIACASGVPLALEVMGSYLHGKGVKEWESALNSYEKNPSKDIQTILKQTYNALDGDLRQLFLDIACFFKGYELSEVEYLLSAHHGYCFKPHRFRLLLETSLIKIDEHNHVKIDRKSVV